MDGLGLEYPGIAAGCFWVAIAAMLAMMLVLRTWDISVYLLPAPPSNQSVT